MGRQQPSVTRALVRQDSWTPQPIFTDCTGLREGIGLRSLHARPLAALCATLLLVAGTVSAPALAAGGPALSRLSPTAVTPGDTLTLTGSGFGSAGPGAAVEFFGPNVTLPAVDAPILSWSPAAITVTAPTADLWPGTADVRIVNPAAGGASSNALPLTITAGAGAVAAPETSWLPAGSGGGGALRVGWNDANGTPSTALLITLPTGTPSGGPGFTVPPAIAAAAVTVNGVPSAGVSVSTGTLDSPGGTGATSTLRITPAPGSAAVPGEITVAVAAAAGIVAPGTSGPWTLQVGPAGGTATVEIQVGAVGVAAYQVSAPADVAAGSPFTVTVTAMGPGGNVLGDLQGPVYLSGGGAVDFVGAQATLTGSTTAELVLSHGTGDVTAVATLPGLATLQATDAAGLTGTASVGITAPAAGAGVQLQVFPSFSGFQGVSAAYTVASVNALQRRSGVAGNGGGSTRIYGGFWPLGVGQGYDAQWNGTITIRAPAALPQPLPQPTLQFALLNVAAQRGNASLTPVAQTGASINGSPLGVGLASASPGAGWVAPTLLHLTPGQYTLVVQATEENPVGGAGDALYYSEAFTTTSASVGINGATTVASWAPLSPVPPAAFTATGLPDATLLVPIGAPTADDAGAPVALQPPARIENSRTLLPLRTIAETLGATVQWDAATQGITVTGARGSPVTQLAIGSTAATVNGAAVTLDQMPLLLPPGVTMVPLRFLGETLGWQVGWDAGTGTAVLLPPLSATVPLRP